MTERLVCDQFKAHWFVQGGAAQFGDIAGENADEIMASILEVVRRHVR